MFLVLSLIGIGIIAYTLSHADEIDQPVTIGISAAAALTVLWNILMVGSYWGYRFQKQGLGKLLVSIVIVGLIVFFTVAAYMGIAPFSDVGGESPSGNGTEPSPTLTPLPTTTPSPTPTEPMPGDVGKTRQDGNLRVTLDEVCLGFQNRVTVELTIENVGEALLQYTRIKPVPNAGITRNPLLNITHPCYAGIQPGRICVYSISDSTHIELQLDNVDIETYLIVQSDDITGNTYGVTFTLPPVNRIPECT